MFYTIITAKSVEDYLLCAGVIAATSFLIPFFVTLGLASARAAVTGTPTLVRLAIDKWEAMKK